MYCGFKPKFILIKNYSGSGTDWILIDTVRDSIVANGENYKQYPNLAVADNGNGGDTLTTNLVNYLSNGFQLASVYGNTNGSGATYVYAAFASNPFKNSLAF